MPSPLEEITSRALGLPEHEQAQLLKALIRHLDRGQEDSPAQVEENWKKEIARRIEEMDAGRAVEIPADQVLAELRDKVG